MRDYLTSIKFIKYINPCAFVIMSQIKRSVKDNGVGQI